MDEILLESIPFQLDVALLRKRTRIREGSPYTKELESLAVEAGQIARPRTCFRPAYIDERSSYRVVIEGVPFTSRILQVNLEKVHRVFPYLATCGAELEEWAAGIRDPLFRFWAETIKEMALNSAINAFNRATAKRYAIRRGASIAPGSLDDWPLMQQANLFQLLGDMPAAIGVRLTENLMMIPTKTVSGIRYQTTESFESCQLCSRANCPGRRAPYDAGLWARKYEPGNT